MYGMSLFDKPASIKQDFFMHRLAFSKMVRLFAFALFVGCHSCRPSRWTPASRY